MSETSNYNLYICDDYNVHFLEWRDKINGSDNSNMVKIDAALSDQRTLTGTTAPTTSTVGAVGQHYLDTFAKKEYICTSANGSAYTWVSTVSSTAEEIGNVLSTTQLKIATIDKELSDHANTLSQININQEAKQTIAGYDKILSLPKNAANGNSSFGLKGMTAQNLIANGDFSQGATGWTYYSAVGVYDNQAKYTVNKQYGGVHQDISDYTKYKGHKLYFSAEWKTDSANNYLVVNDGKSQTTVSHIGDNVMRKGCGLHTVSENTVNLYIKIQDARPSGWTETQADNFMIIDLTATFGAGNEPDVATCDKMFANYFDGMKSTKSRGRIKSVSFDGTQSTAKYINSTEPLRRVPSASDEVRQKSDGGYEMVQRCKEYTLVASDFFGLNTVGANVDFVQIWKPADSIGKGNTTKNWLMISPYAESLSTADVVENVGKFNLTYNVDLIYLCVAKGTYADLPAVKTALAGTKIIYQLATPIITPIDTSGTLLSYPFGSVYWEPITADAGVYNNGINVLATGFPISALERLSKVDFTTGIETALDISAATISSGGLSFTHPNLVNGDIVFFTYSFKNDAPEGNKAINYYDSRYVIKDSVTGKFYQWGITVASGVPAFDLVEV